MMKLSENIKVVGLADYPLFWLVRNDVPCLLYTVVHALWARVRHTK